PLSQLSSGATRRRVILARVGRGPARLTLRKARAYSLWRTFEPMISVDDKESCAACVSAALATIVRGKLCDKLLSNRIPVMFEKDDILYDLGDGDHTFFFLQSGVVKVGTMTEDGHEI